MNWWNVKKFMRRPPERMTVRNPPSTVRGSLSTARMAATA